MSKEVVQREYDAFLERMGEKMVEATEDEIGWDGLVGSLIGKAAGVGARARVMSIKDEMKTQGRIVVNYAEARAMGQDDLDRYERRFIETNPVVERYDGDATRELHDDLLHHFRQVGSDLAPLIEADVDPATGTFYDALRSEYSRDEAKEVIDANFEQASTFKKYSDGLTFDSPGIDQDTVIDIIEKGESELKKEIYREIDRAYNGS